MKLSRIFAIVCVFACTSIAWLILGGVTSNRTSTQASTLRETVDQLWGTPLVQEAPEIIAEWEEDQVVTREEYDDNGKPHTIKERVKQVQQVQATPDSSKLQVNLRLDQRLKGLMWYSLYDVDFAGGWSYVASEPKAKTLRLRFRFPDPSAIYDDFYFELNGQRMDQLVPNNGVVETVIPIAVGDRIQFRIGYSSRGLDSYVYRPAANVASLRDFDLSMHTDFAEIDFPASTMSPSSKSLEPDGWKLSWKFAQVVTGKGIGMAMPTKIQPGDLASALSFSAPISLFFYFLVIFVLAALRGIEIHPINYLFLGGAFFAFHLLFAYSVDRLTLVPAFALASAVSLALVGSYLRLVVSPRFALVEAALAQLIYLVGFSLAHFWDGYTGLTVTVLSILTLFLLMQLTGRIRWGEALSQKNNSGGAHAHAHP